MRAGTGVQDRPRGPGDLSPTGAFWWESGTVETTFIEDAGELESQVDGNGTKKRASACCTGPESASFHSEVVCLRARADQAEQGEEVAETDLAVRAT